MGNYYYCPYCGKTQFKTNNVCIKCEAVTNMIPSELDSEYYRQKSMSMYGDYTHWEEFLLNEIKKNPTFCLAKYNAAPSEKNKPIVNQPHCPTCNSTNVKKISDLRRGAHAVAWGLLSTTARSQFECKNCGYKW